MCMRRCTETCSPSEYTQMLLLGYGLALNDSSQCLVFYDIKLIMKLASGGAYLTQLSLGAINIFREHVPTMIATIDELTHFSPVTGLGRSGDTTLVEVTS